MDFMAAQKLIQAAGGRYRSRGVSLLWQGA